MKHFVQRFGRPAGYESVDEPTVKPSLMCPTHAPDPDIRALWQALGAIPAGCFFAARLVVRSQGRLCIPDCGGEPESNSIAAQQRRKCGRRA